LPPNSPNNTQSTPSTSQERHFYQRILALEIRQIALCLFFLSILLYVAQSAWHFFLTPPIPGIAEALFVVSAVGITYDWFARRELDKKLSLAIRSELALHRSEILHELPSVLLDGRIQKELLQRSKVQDVLCQLLETLAGEKLMADALARIVLDRGLAFEERWTNYRYQMVLRDIVGADVPKEIREQYFELQVRIRYDAILRRKELIFALASGLDEFNQMLDDNQYEARWLCPPSRLFEFHPEYFLRIDKVEVDDIALVAGDAKKRLPYTIACTHKEMANKIGKEVTVSYVFSTKIRKDDRALFTTVVCPTHDIVIEFEFGGASLKQESVDVIDYFVSPVRARIEQLPSRQAPTKIIVEVRNWVFPKGGAIFMWDI
jgi:hypothetical protein